MTFSMDVKEYKNLIAAGKTDGQIISMKQTTAAFFNKWKRANGLVKPRFTLDSKLAEKLAPLKEVEQPKQTSEVLLREKETVTANENPSDDTVGELKKQIKAIHTEHLRVITQHEKDMNELYERLKQANSANATLAFDVVNAQDELEKLRSEIGVTPNNVANLKMLEEENALLRDEMVSLRNQVFELTKFNEAETTECDDSLVNDLYAKIDLLNKQLARQATQITGGNSAIYIDIIEEEELFQTQLLRKLLAEREQRIALREENKILSERVGLV